jgi:ferredoxin--NADP+ reductase
LEHDLSTRTPSAYRIAVVGAGPGGLYAAQAALTVPHVETIDVFDRLPTPYGLVRYGVAADHAKTKSVVRALQRVLENERVRFFGCVAVGTDVTRDELRQRYDAVIYSTGALQDRGLGIPGEQLPGSHGAAEFVSWYSGHPDALERWTQLSATTAVVIGAGNVALDVARILAKDAAELHPTDMPDAVISALTTSTITDIHVLARRGPADAKFSSVELRELGELANAEVVVHAGDLANDPAVAEVTPTPTVANNLSILAEWSQRPSIGRPRRIHLHFWTRPNRIAGDTQVSGIEVEHRPPGMSAAIRMIDAQLVLRAIGYQPQAPIGLPFDAARGVVPNVAGRVLGADARVSSREYVAGWLKRGPSGVIGTNRGDAAETVTALAEDLAGSQPVDCEGPDVQELLAARGVQIVGWDGWKRLESHEQQLGTGRGAPAVKLPDWAGMLAVCHVVEA